MFCRKCGNEVYGNFCGRCGEKVVRTKVGTNKVSKRLIVLFLTLAVFGAMIFCIHRFIQINKSDNEPDKKESEIISYEERIDGEHSFFNLGRDAIIFAQTELYDTSDCQNVTGSVWLEDVKMLSRDDGVCNIKYDKVSGYVSESKVYEWVYPEYYMALYFMDEYSFEIYDLGEIEEINHSDSINPVNFYSESCTYTFHALDKIDAIGIMPGGNVIDDLSVGKFTYSDLKNKYEFGYNAPSYDVNSGLYVESIYVCYSYRPYEIKYYFAEPSKDATCLFAYISKVE